MKSTFRVSICGGGIGGLALALVLSKYGSHTVEIFEAGPTITTIGAGIAFFGRTMDILKELGLYDEFVKMAPSPPQENSGPTFRKSDQVDGYEWFSRRLKRGDILIHRKDLVDFLLRQITPSCKVHTSKRLEFYDADPASRVITMYFTDGSTAVTDVLVGADGIHSATRRTMYQRLVLSAHDDESRKKLLDCIKPVFTGIMVYRNVFPAEKLQKEFPGVEPPTELIMHLGKNQHIVTFPISQGKLINVVIFQHNPSTHGTRFEGHWVTDVSEEEVMNLYEGWEPRARALVKCVERPSRWALHSLRSLPHYVHGKVALLGDAAHAMEPHFGAGAGQALEDAFILGRLLTHELTHLDNVADALKTYEQVRLPFANGVVQRSHEISGYYSFNRVSADGSVPEHGSPEELEFVKKAIEDAWEWQSEGAWVWSDAEEQWKTKCADSAKF